MKVLALLAALLPVAAIADPIASSGFTGGEDPLSENGAWAPLTSLSPNGGRFQKNNAAFPNRFSPDHAGARTTAAIPDDHYSEIVVGHLASQPVNNNVGPTVRVQASGPTVDSHYLWWAGPTNGVNDLYRIDANGTSFTSTAILPTSAVADGDRLRLIARGPVIYGIKNGAREFIYNTGIDGTKLSGGTAGILAFVSGPALSDASIASWSAGAAPVSSGTWTSSDFAGVENPLDENDRWYPLPGYAGFRKAGGLASGLSTGHNASGVWSIAPPATQYSEVTLGTSVGGGGGPMVRIDRTNPGQTGWLLFLSADGTSGSGIYKVNPDGSFDLRRPFTPTIVPGDKWRLAADGNTLEVSQNGISQFTFTTDGSYPSGDVGIEALSSAFTFSAWEGGNPNGGPTIVSFSPSGGSPGTIVDITGTNFTSATAVAFNGTSATFTVTSDTVIQATVPAGATTGPLSVTTPSGTATTTGSFQIADPPTITGFAPGGGRPGAGVGIEGSGFTGATAVTFNGVSASFTVTTSIHIEATVPAGATTGPISVATPAGTATSTSVFTVGDPPTITSFAPASAPMGATVTISGTSFTSTSAVLFTQGVSASFTVISDTTIQATVPAGAMTGPLSVMTAVGGTSSSAPFTVQDAPAITGFTPASGPAGTGVTITGTSFTGATSVSFGAVSAAFTVVSDTQIQTAVPVGAKQGFVGLFVTTPGGKAQAADSFRVTGPPQIGSFTPSGPVGSSVTISGLDFTGATQVAFNGVSAGFAVVSDAEIQTTVPAGATSGPISVTTPLGTGTSRNSFFVTARLFVTKAGSGAGSVTSTSSPRNPNVTFSEINCGNVCSVPYAVGTVVTLNATAAAGSNFTGWIGCDSVSGTACTVTMNDARTITANFTQAFPLTVTKASTLGIGSGTVTSTSSPDAPGQIDCGSNCSVRFNSGTVVTLTATPDLLSVFNGWSGCDSASGPTCTVTMSAAKSVTANFLP